ncbi:MAG: glycosyltransferase family 2 protein [Candidatus Levyibacteriota bacterium]|nr:MAG: glycosyltransferase family 2 protein [Candidatus Levybacteria bacterium]
MPSLSVVLATYNEEKNLPDCLKSVRGITDEIVVVDGGSKDKTVDVAKKYGARVIITTNPSIFHINKQKAIDIATKDWILQLDGDERVTPELKKEILDVLDKKPETNGYWMPRKNWFLGRFLMKGGQYPDYTLRLYRKGKGRLPQMSVHEQAIVEGNVEYLKNPLLHIAYPSFSGYLTRLDRYTNLIASELRVNKVGYSPIISVKYMLFLPLWWFFLTYFRHKGFMDSWQGLIFSFFSALRFPIAYIKFIKKINEN